jgi:hypothetical protein
MRLTAVAQSRRKHHAKGSSVRHLKTLTGNGTVTPGGGRPVSVRYRLKLFGEELPDAAGEIVPRVQSIRGSITPFCGSHMEKLTLQMEGGETLEFSFTDYTGNATAAGGIVNHS